MTATNNAPATLTLAAPELIPAPSADIVAEAVALVRYVATPASLAKMRIEYQVLDARVDYKATVAARAHCRDLRGQIADRHTEVKKPYWEACKALDDAKRVMIGEVSEIEKPLAESIAAVDAEKARIKREQERAELIALEKKLEEERLAREEKAYKHHQEQEAKLAEQRKQLAEDKAKQDAIDAERRRQAAIEAEERRKAQAIADAKAKAERDRLERDRRELQAEKDALEAEKRAKAKEASDKLAQEQRLRDEAQAAQEQRNRDEAERQRLEALKPDAEKIRMFGGVMLEAFNAMAWPEVTAPEAVEFRESLIADLLVILERAEKFGM